MPEVRHPRDLPRTDAVRDALVARFPDLPVGLCTAAARGAIDAARQRVLGGETVDTATVEHDAVHQLAAWARPALVPVINATGIVVHTNLGRAPWAPEAVRAAGEVAGRYACLELDLDSGRRGGRLDGVAERLVRLTGAEAALVVNNGAAAVLLALTALAAGRGVVVSRGELVEIGGSFRVPEVIAAGGARLVEVGTTNRTRVSDFERATTSDTAVYLHVHPSNFRIEGFTEQPGLGALARAGRAAGVAVVADLGSGSLDGVREEPSVRAAVADGVDVVCFSGDKLLGGPQAGVLVGRATAIGRLRAHPLYRALRCDKALLAALEATLRLHEAGASTPVDRMLAAPAEASRTRAGRWRDALVARGLDGLSVEDTEGFVGGGALPAQALPSAALVVRVEDAAALARRLRQGDPAVVARVHRGAVWLDPRTVAPAEEEALVLRLADAIPRR